MWWPSGYGQSMGISATGVLRWRRLARESIGLSEAERIGRRSGGSEREAVARAAQRSVSYANKSGKAPSVDARDYQSAHVLREALRTVPVCGKCAEPLASSRELAADHTLSPWDNGSTR